MAKLEGWLGLLTSQRCAFGRSLERFKQITLKSFRCPGLLNVLLRNVWLKGNVFWEVHYFLFQLKLCHPFPVWTVWKWTSVFSNYLLLWPQVLSALCASSAGSLSGKAVWIPPFSPHPFLVLVSHTGQQNGAGLTQTTTSRPSKGFTFEAPQNIA